MQKSETIDHQPLNPSIAESRVLTITETIVYTITESRVIWRKKQQQNIALNHTPHQKKKKNLTRKVIDKVINWKKMPQSLL